jgi:hypothetical protein
MGGDDDIAAALPRPPHPAPARREAAIAAALRRFDGAEARPAAAGERSRPAAWWPRPGRPFAGALAAAALVAVVGVPWAWQSFDDYAAQERGAPPPAAQAPPSAPPQAAADAAAEMSPPPPPAEAAEPSADAVVGREGERRASADPALAPATKAAEPVPGRGEAAVAGAEADSSSDVIVTGSRIRNPNLASSSPVTVIGEQDIAVTGTRARRGDWNACTIDDPGRDLRACRRANPVAKGVPARSSAHVAAGLGRAWQGEVEEAIADFDRAIEAAPRSSEAYLNRGLARRRLGDRDGALADLDRAVRNDPSSARAHYHRSLLLRERGETRRARADEDRAVELDPSYGPVVRARRRQAR